MDLHASRAKTVRRRKDARPSEIIDAAALVFAQHGYAATNLERVAEQADISKGTIYRYFDDKHVLFEAVIKAKLFDQLEAPPLDLFAQPTNASQTLRHALLLAYQLGKTSNPSDLIRILLLEGDRFAQLRQDCIERLLVLGSNLVRAILDHHDQGGDLKASPFYANPAALFFPIICATALYKDMHKTAGFDVDQFVETYLDMSCAALIMPTLEA
jgi:AcrR family transcriptional regulator